MTCHKCGREINHEQFPLGLTFCPYCGDRIGGHDLSQAISFCPYCGRRLLVAAAFCPECGKQVAPGTASSHAPACSVMPVFPRTPHIPKASLPFEEDEGAPLQGQFKRQYPFPLDEEVSEAVTAKPSVSPFRSLGSQLAAVGRRIYEPIESLITGRWRLKRLYRDWSVHDALPPEEIPSDNYLKNSSRQTPTSAAQIPSWLILLIASLAAVLLFVAIGILIWRS